jgi:hypothetical protein
MVHILSTIDTATTSIIATESEATVDCDGELNTLHQAEELYLSDPNENPLFFTVYKAFSCLMDVYMCMSHIPFDGNIYGQLCRQFLLLYKAIGAKAADPFWKIKPKFHLMQELGEFMSVELGSPEHFWAYKDESYVGFIAQIATSRGGQNNAGTTPNRLIQRVRALTAE